MSGVAKCPEMDLNHRPIDFQSIASTAELSGRIFLYTKFLRPSGNLF